MIDRILSAIDPLLLDIKAIGYITLCSTLGAISALASLLGMPSKALNIRVVSAYVLAGGLVSAGITFFLVDNYGFSYPILGISIFAGYKAFDTLSVVGVAVSKLAKVIMDRLFDK